MTGVTSYNHIHGTRSSEGKKATGGKGTATTLELGTYALSQSFGHASNKETGRDPSSPIALMYWSQVCRYPATLQTCTSRLVLCAM